MRFDVTFTSYPNNDRLKFCHFPLSETATDRLVLKHHYVKIVRIRNFSGPYFTAFGLNTERYYITLCIQSKYRKIWTRKTPDTGTFHAVHKTKIF